MLMRREQNPATDLFNKNRENIGKQLPS